MTLVKECILCEKENTHIYFGICVICHLKIDEAMGNISYLYQKQENKLSKMTEQSGVKQN